MGEHRIQRQILQNVGFLGCQRNFRDIWWLSSDYYKPNPQSIKHSPLVAYVNPVRDPKDFSMWPIEFVADGIPPVAGVCRVQSRRSMAEEAKKCRIGPAGVISTG